jgi:hypothetical protein
MHARQAGALECVDRPIQADKTILNDGLLPVNNRRRRNGKVSWKSAARSPLQGKSPGQHRLRRPQQGKTLAAAVGAR